jgi:hypothetical protein
MNNGNLHTLILLADFKTILGLDDRDDVLSRYCLVTATCTIEQYCRRRLLKKKHLESFDFHGDYILPLREYPVREVSAVYQQPRPLGEPTLISPYHCIPDCGIEVDIPFCLSISPRAGLKPEEGMVKVCYWAGYETGEIPPDLASACLELAAWNMARYRGRRIGLTGAVRGKGQDGEHLEPSMPENVRQLLEPYRRWTI